MSPAALNLTLMFRRDEYSTFRKVSLLDRNIPTLGKYGIKPHFPVRNITVRDGNTTVREVSGRAAIPINPAGNPVRTSGFCHFSTSFLDTFLDHLFSGYSQPKGNPHRFLTFLEITFRKRDGKGAQKRRLLEVLEGRPMAGPLRTGSNPGITCQKPDINVLQLESEKQAYCLAGISGSDRFVRKAFQGRLFSTFRTLIFSESRYFRLFSGFSELRIKHGSQ